MVLTAVGEESLYNFILNKPVIGVFLSGIIGLIPNCAASVLITEMYLEGILNFGSMISGLMVGAGVGLLVLFRTNKRWKENLSILGIVFGAGIVWGLIVNLLL